MTLVLDDGVELEVSTDLELGLTEPRDFHHHVVEAGLLARDQGDVVPRRDDPQLVLEEDFVPLITVL